MTKKELYRMRYLKKAIMDKTDRYKEMKERINSLPSACSTFNEVKTHNHHNSVTEKLVIAICELEDQIIEDKIEHVRLMKKFYTWQPTIKDGCLRLILELYFVNGYSYLKIAGLIDDKPKKSRYDKPEISESGCKMKIYRFFKDNDM